MEEITVFKSGLSPLFLLSPNFNVKDQTLRPAADMLNTASC